MKRPIQFYQTAWNTFTNDHRSIPKYQKCLDAFQYAGQQHNVALSGCMTNKKYAHSYMCDDVKRKIIKCGQQ